MRPVLERHNVNNEKADKPETPARPRPAAALLFQAPDLTLATPQPVVSETAEQSDEANGRKKPARTRKRKDDHDSKSVDKHGEDDKAPARKRRSQAEAKKTQSKSESSQLSASGEDKGAAAAGDAEEKPAAKRRGRAKKSENEAKKATSSEADEPTPKETAGEVEASEDSSSHRRRRRRSRTSSESVTDEITALKGSTRLEAKRRRRREGRKESHRHHAITESEFLARRESVDRRMLIRERDGLNQIAVIEDGLLVEHYVARHTQTTMVGSVYLGKVQNVLPSMEAAFIDLGKGRNAVLYAGEVNWDAAGLQGHPRRIEAALKAGDTVLVQVTKDPIGHKGARLTAQVTLAGRYLVLVPDGAMTGISRKLPEKERRRLKKLLKAIVPSGHGVIIRTAAEGATKEQLEEDVKRLLAQWQSICDKQKSASKAPQLLHGEPELALRVVRDVFNEDFRELLVEGKQTWKSVSEYVGEYAPDLADRMRQWVDNDDLFVAHRVDEQLAKGMDRKVWLPSGGHLVIDRTEAMTVVDVNTGKYTGGASGTLEETVTKNNLEAAEEIVRQLRLRDIGGIIVIDFVDMVLPANRDLVLRRLIECLGRDRTRHQVTEVTSLGLVQMTRKRVGEGLVEAFSTPCECCEGRGFIVHDSPVEKESGGGSRKTKRARAKDKDERAEADKRANAKKQAARSMSKIAHAAKASEDKASEDKADGDEASGQPSAQQARSEASPKQRSSAARKQRAEDPQSSAAERAHEAVVVDQPVAASTAGALIISDIDALKAEKAAQPKRPARKPQTPKVDIAERTATEGRREAVREQAAPSEQSGAAALIIEV